MCVRVRVYILYIIKMCEYKCVIIYSITQQLKLK